MIELAADGFLFDSDGVLVDSLESAAEAWDEWSARYAPSFDFRTQVEHGRRAEELVAALVAPEVAGPATLVLEDLEVARAGLTVAIAGALDLVASIPQDRRVVVTSGARRLAAARLAAAGIDARAIVAAEDVAVGKPEPDPYLAGARLLGLDPQRCIVLEDAPAGVLAARRAGVAAVVGVGDHLEGADVDAHVEDLTALRYDAGTLYVSGPP